MAYQDEVMADSPVLYLRLSETSGTTANDETTNNLDGSYVNAPTLGVSGAVVGSTAVTFNGTDQYVTVPDNNLLDLTDNFSVELWFKRGTFAANGHTLISKGANSSRIYFAADDTLFFALVGTGAMAISSIAITDSNWHHIVCSKNGATNKLYLDGVDRTGSTFNRTLSANTTALNIARHTDGTDYFPGAVDEVALYPSALSLSRVQVHYSTPGSASGNLLGAVGI